MMLRRGRVFLSVVLAWAAGTTCVDKATGPSVSGPFARLALAPSFSAAAAKIYRNLETFGLGLDNVQIRVQPIDEDVGAVKDTVVMLSGVEEEITVELLVPMTAAEERMRAFIDLRDGDQVLFSATQEVLLRRGLPSSRPEAVELEYIGPGATAVFLSVTPATATIFANDSVQLTPTALDANQQSVPVGAIAWEVTDAARGTVSETGVFRPSATRGQALVVGRLPTGLRDTASISVIPVPSQITLVSGGGQSATVGAALPQPIVVEVHAADNQPVPGFTVGFAVTAGGGSLTTTTATSDANGRASTTLTLGTIAGANTVAVTSGAATLNVGATGTAGAAARLAMAQQPSVTVVSGDALAAQPQVRVEDALGNTVATAGTPVTAQLTTPAGRTLTGTTTRTTNASGVAVFTDLVITGPAGATTLTFTSGNLASIASNNINVLPGALNSVSWINAAGGNWSVGANWSSGAPPTASEIATINLAGTYTVTLDVNATVGGLVLGGATGTQTLAGTTRTLTVDGVGTIAASGVLSLSTTSVLGGSGTVTNQGTIVLLSSSTAATTALQNEGLLLAHGASTINGPLTTSAASILRAQGQSSGGTSTFTVTNGFTNNGLIELTSIDGGFQSVFNVTNGTLTNAASGTIRSSTGSAGPRTLGAQLNNLGTLDVDQALTLSRASSQHANAGTIDLTGTANLTITQTGTTPSFTNTGAITLGVSRDLSISGGVVDVDAGTISGTPTSTLIVSGAQLAVTTSTVTIPMTLTTTTIVGGSVTIPNGQTLTLLNGGLTDPVTIADGGTLLTHGAVSLTGAVSMPALGSTLRVRGQSNGGTGALTIANGFTNNGLIELTSQDGGFTATLTVTNGTLTNATGATLRSAVGAAGPRSLAAQLDNQGTLDVDQPLTLARASSQHVNSGAIDLTTANLIVTQTGTTPSFTNTGTITLAASRDLTISGGLVDVDAGTISGTPTSTLVVSSAQIAFTTATVTIPMTLTAVTIVGGSFTIPSGQTLTLLSGGLSDPLTIATGGTLLTHGTVSLTGALTTQANATLRVRGQSNGGTGALTVLNGFTNNGLIELTSQDGGFTSTLTVTNGVLLNAAGGTIRAAAGAAGPRLLAAQLNNQGTLDLDIAMTLSRASSQHINSGTIDLTAANLIVTQTGTTPSFTNTGTITLAANRDLTLTGGLVDVDAGSISGTPTSTLTVSGAQLAFTTATVTIPMTLTTTTIVGGSVTIPNAQTLTLLSGGLNEPVTIQSGGTLLALGGVTLNGSLGMPAGSTLRVRGQSFGGAGALTVTNGFANNGLIELTTADGGFGSQLTVTNGELLNATGATIRAAAGTAGSRLLAAQLLNQGTLDVDLALTLARASSQHINSGTIDLTAANLTVTQTGTNPSFTNNGGISLAANRDLTITGGAVNLGQGMIAGTVTSTVTVSGAALSFTPPNVNVPMTITTSTINGGNVTIATGQLLTLLNSSLSDRVVVQNGGTLMTHGTTSLTNSLTMQTGATLRVRGQSFGGTGDLTVTNGFTNAGLIELTSQDGGFTTSLNVPNGTLANAAGATIRSAVGASGPRTLSAELNNLGTLEVLQPLTLARAGSAHVNSSLIDLRGANLTITGAASFTNNSNVVLGSGRTLTVSGGSMNLGQGVITGPVDALLVVNNATMSFTPPNVTVPMTLNNAVMATGLLAISDAQTVTLLNGGVNEAVTIGSGGTLLTHGTVALNGPLTQNGTLRVQGQSIGGNAVLTVANGFTNGNLIELTSANGGFGSTLAVTNGTLTNGGENIIRSAVGAAGPRTIAAELVNDGFLFVDQSLTLNRANAAHVSNSDITLSTGDLTVVQSGTGSFTNTASIFLGTRSFVATGGVVNNVNFGTFFGTGTINVAGTTFNDAGQLWPAGSNVAGTMTITGAYNQTAAARYLISLGPTAAQNDRINISGAAALAGQLQVEFVGGFNPAPGAQFTVMTYGSRTGTFSSVPAGWMPIYNTNSFVLQRQ